VHGFFERFSDRSSYRLVSSFLVAAGLLPAFFLISIGHSWAWAVFAWAIAAPAYVVLVILTYFRLHDAGRSGWWLLPMIFVIQIGPSWLLGSWGPVSVRFSLSGMLSLLPVIIGWVALRRHPSPLSSELPAGQN